MARAKTTTDGWEREARGNVRTVTYRIAWRTWCVPCRHTDLEKTTCGQHQRSSALIHLEERSYFCYSINRKHAFEGSWSVAIIVVATALFLTRKPLRKPDLDGTIPADLSADARKRLRDRVGRMRISSIRGPEWFPLIQMKPLRVTYWYWYPSLRERGRPKGGARTVAKSGRR